MFSAPISAISIIFLSLSLAGIVTACVYGLAAYIRTVRDKSTELPDDESEYPKASVVIYSDCAEDMLEKTLDAMVMEDYPDFEIIVVCDLPSDQASILKERYAARYKNVYVTFIPPGSHNVSRRKLAITSGVKAASGEIIVTTSGNIELPDSHLWLRNLLAPFCGAQGKYTDISLGVSVIRAEDFKGPLGEYMQFDSTLSKGLWIGYALQGKTYRGDGNNLAFRRSVFLQHKGYAKTINIHNGDDDLFISEISNPANTKAVINQDSILRLVCPGDANRTWSERKEGYNFTAKWLRKSPFIRDCINDLLQWFVPGFAIAGLVTSLPNLTGMIIGICLILIFWGLEIYLYNKLASKLKTARMWYQPVPFWLARFLCEIIFRLANFRRSKQNYTWVR